MNMHLERNTFVIRLCFCTPKCTMLLYAFTKTQNVLPFKVLQKERNKVNVHFVDIVSIVYTAVVYVRVFNFLSLFNLLGT